MLDNLRRLLHAREYWKKGSILLQSEQDFQEAQACARYWAKYVPHLPEIDEAVYLGVMHFYGYVADEAFWKALVQRYQHENVGSWYTALDTIVGCGNVPALNALASKFDSQTLFYRFYGDGERIRPMHPAALQWFLQDEGLAEPLKKYVYVFEHDWYREIRWDAVQKTYGARAMVSIVEQWCQLPDPWFPEAHAMTLALSWVGLQAQLQVDSRLQGGLNFAVKDPEIGQAIEKVAERAGLHAGLLRTIGGRMQGRDYHDPVLCAVALYRLKSNLDPFHNVRGRHVQIQLNASRVGHISPMLELHG